MTNVMDAFPLSCSKRTISGRRLRHQSGESMIPAVVYGHGFPSESLSLAKKDFQRFLRRAHATPLVELQIESATPVPAVVQDVQRDMSSDDPIHVDFHRLRMEERLTTSVPIELVGTSRAVKELGGVLVKLLNTFTIECLPKDLVASITVDLGGLNAIGDAVRVRDLTIPKGIVLKYDPEDMVVIIQESKAEVVETAKPEADVAQVEVVGKKPKAEAEEEATPEVKPKKE